MTFVEWKGSSLFEAQTETGNRFLLDAPVGSGGQGAGPSPLEALLSAVAACSAMDVIQILAKKRQPVTAYRVEVDGERTEEGVFPRPFKKIVIRHIVEGDDVDPEAVQHAVRLSDEKYCSAIATLRTAPEVLSEFEVRVSIG